MLKGSLVAVVTPMQTGGALDLPAFRKLIDFHVANGTRLVVVGTTGESPTVDVEEHCLLIKTAVEHAAGRIPVVAGTGANATAEAIELTAYAKKVGAASSLSVVPYYNKPSQEGLIGISAPSRSRSAAAAPVQRAGTHRRRSRQRHRVASRAGAGHRRHQGRDRGPRAGQRADLGAGRGGQTEFAVYSGEDITALPLNAMGGVGCISVTANVAPKLMAQMCAAALAGDCAGARAANDRLLPLHRKLFIEANPIPVKWALAEMGLIGGDLRLPLTALAAQHHDTVRAALREAGCL
jgi:4-hydroxy-tetrahydrodipicolinate synthase